MNLTEGIFQCVWTVGRRGGSERARNVMADKTTEDDSGLNILALLNGVLKRNTAVRGVQSVLQMQMQSCTLQRAGGFWSFSRAFISHERLLTPANVCIKRSVECLRASWCLTCPH